MHLGMQEREQLELKRQQANLEKLQLDTEDAAAQGEG